MNDNGTSGSSCAVPVPRRYEIVDKDGHTVNAVFMTGSAAGAAARVLWPDQEQDEDHTGKGWDVRVMGCKNDA